MKRLKFLMFITALLLAACATNEPLNSELIVTISNQTVTLGEQVNLEARVSNEEGVVTFVWSLLVKPEASQLSLQTTDKQQLSFVADALGEFEFLVKAADSLSQTEARVQVTVVASTTAVVKDIIEEEGVSYAVLEDGQKFQLVTEEDLLERSDVLGDEEASLELQQTLPSRIDLTANQTDIRNQSGRGTCQTFATLAAIEASYNRSGFGQLDLSEQYANHVTKMARLDADLYSSDSAVTNTAAVRDSQRGPAGGYSTAGQLILLKDLLIPLETDAPYVPFASYADMNQANDNPRFSSDPSVFPVASQAELNAFNLQDEESTYQIPSSLLHTPFPRTAQQNAKYGVTGFVAANNTQLKNTTWYEQQLNAGREIIFGYCIGGADPKPENDIWDPGEGTNCGGHAILVVGYDRTDPDNPYFIIKNSWGGGNRNFGKLSYDFVTGNKTGRVISAHYLTGVKNPNTTDHSNTSLGRWDASLDGETFTLDFYRLADYYKDSNFSPNQKDRRLGTLFNAAGTTFRVNGSINTQGKLDFYADFATPNLNFETLSGNQFSAFVDNNDPLFMAGYYETPTAKKLGFYAHKDGKLASNAKSSSFSETSFSGVWALHHATKEGFVELEKLASGWTGAFYSEGDRDAFTPIIDVATQSLKFSLAGLGNFEGYLHTNELGIISGLLSNTSGMVLARQTDVTKIQITQPNENARFDEGTIDFKAVIEGVDVTNYNISWFYTLASGTTIGLGSSKSGETLSVSSLCDGSYDISARAIHSSGSKFLTDTVSIVVSNASPPPAACAPSINISSPSEGASFALGTDISFSAVIEDDNDTTDAPIYPILWRLGGPNGLIIARDTLNFNRDKFSAGEQIIYVEYGTASDQISINLIETNNTAPTVTINSPQDGANLQWFDYYDGIDDTNIPLQGTARDAEDGNLTGSSLAWSYRVKGTATWQPIDVGNTAVLGLRLFSPVRTYELRLTATDSSNPALQGEDIIEFTILGPPS